MVLSLAMAEQLASATGTGYQIGTSLVSKPQQSKLRKANRPRKPLSNPNRGKVAIDLSELLRKRMAECAHASDPYVSERRLCRAVREGNQEPRPALYSPGGLYEGDVVLYSKSDNAVEGRPSE
ncbi:hypothetical protein PC112_g15998 [Phytophthora cactorum]|nr:hypothetical protein PC112_g15998 [Phytophthora cactorum]